MNALLGWAERVWVAVWAVAWGLGAAAAAWGPVEEQASFEFADPGLMAELVASEPAVTSPVAIAWDAAGRLLVAEMRDYPNASGGGAIRQLADLDGDGVYESSQIYADGLAFPNSVLPWRDGVLVTAAPDLLFLRDADGDGRAEERRVLFSGFGTGNQQLRANGLQWGGDGWIYGANGRSDGVVRRPGVAGEFSLRGRDFRFRPDTGEFETLAGRSQFGLAWDDWGNRFLSWNTIPARHEVLPDRYLARNSRIPNTDVLQDLLPVGDEGQIFPLTPPPRVFNNESSRHFNALAGLTVYRGNALGPAYRGNLFVGESLANLVHRRVLEPEGATYTARRGELQTEFLRSRDPWFHPVNFATGPDGALYIVDFHREFVEHPDFVPREMRDRVDWRTGREQGRIWRVRRRVAPRWGSPPDLQRQSARELAQWVAGDNAWAADTAQRLLIERQDRTSTRSLTQAVTRGKSAAGRSRALQTLDRLSALREDVLMRALADADERVRAAAVVLLESRLAVPAPPPRLVKALLQRARDVAARVRLRAACVLGSLPDDSVREPALEGLWANDPDQWVRRAAVGASRREIPAALFATLWPSSATPRRPMPILPPPAQDREKIVRQYQAALTSQGDPQRGAALFARLCLACHSLQGLGYRVGPDLAGIGVRPPEALLVDILDPSRQVAPDSAAYEFELENGETVTGLFASETTTRITVRRPGGPDDNLPRARLRSVKPSGRSLMPDGLEAEISREGMNDLLSFLRQPEAVELPR